MEWQQLTVKVPKNDAELVRQISVHRGENMSGFARRAIKFELARVGFLDVDSARALGVKNVKD